MEHAAETLDVAKGLGAQRGADFSKRALGRLPEERAGQRLEERLNIHRNTMVATPEILYVADSRSCKKIDAASGEVLGEILAPESAAGPVWKWMAIEDGVLYALVGGQEVRDPTLRGTRTEAGWPWLWEAMPSSPVAS